MGWLPEPGRTRRQGAAEARPLLPRQSRSPRRTVSPGRPLPRAPALRGAAPLAGRKSVTTATPVARRRRRTPTSIRPLRSPRSHRTARRPRRRSRSGRTPRVVRLARAGARARSRVADAQRLDGARRTAARPAPPRSWLASIEAHLDAAQEAAAKGDGKIESRLKLRAWIAWRVPVGASAGEEQLPKPPRRICVRSRRSCAYAGRCRASGRRRPAPGRPPTRAARSSRSSRASGGPGSGRARPRGRSSRAVRGCDVRTAGARGHTRTQLPQRPLGRPRDARGRRRS